MPNRLSFEDVISISKTDAFRESPASSLSGLTGATTPIAIEIVGLILRS